MRPGTLPAHAIELDSLASAGFVLEWNAMKIITNNVPRPIVSGCELAGKQREQAQSDYDFLDDDDFEAESFVIYRGRVHYLGNFLKTQLDGWDGIEPDGMTSGTVIKLVGDDEAVLGYATSEGLRS